jgi:2',3'-cyclic-nucleotide 2'-phosphodiesterase (5'-nucleotidase family)
MLYRVLLICGLLGTAPLHAQTVLPVKSYGQELVDQVVAKYPELLVIVMHVSTPTLPNYPIIASNIGRYGKVADEDDMRVVNTEKPNLEPSRDQKRFEVEVVMRDITGTNIGALGLVFPYKPGDDKAGLERKGNAIRDALARRVIAAAALTEPHPLDATATTKTHAQKLVERLYARHPDLNVIALHVDMPKDQGNIILASTFGRIGKKADSDDMNVIKTGEVRTGVYGDGKRFGIELPMYDATGKTIGALSVGYAYKKNDDEKAMVAKAIVVRDELKALTTSVAELVELDP